MRVDLIYLVYLMSLVLGVCGDHRHDQIPAVTKVVPKHFRVCLERVLSFNITDISELQDQQLQELHKCFSRVEGPCNSSPSPQPTTTPGVSELPRVTLGIILVCMAAVIALLIGVLSTVCFFTCCKKKTRQERVEDNCQL
ncbi:uncharacterized protein LOC124257461 [Haliotis rubra]|uniref:uncharacterized protein LOC124257461 n=1 Tax=Haliotis rubra TaxID=36100 RepID=UPI001EE521DB|nr:uncharacterized protein LOC124257461 [Haliotis rubra]